jgi:CheY-like chemotaxis protein
MMVDSGSRIQASFRFRADTKPCNVSNQAEEQLYKGTETILFVEDEPALAELVQAVLRASGYTVLHAADGLEAIDMFGTHAHAIDVVLTDLELPRLGGWEAFQQMRNVKPSIRAVVASGYFNASLRSQMLQQGAFDFVSKPYLPNDILRSVREVLDSVVRSRSET